MFHSLPDFETIFYYFFLLQLSRLLCISPGKIQLFIYITERIIQITVVLILQRILNYENTSNETTKRLENVLIDTSARISSDNEVSLKLIIGLIFR